MLGSSVLALSPERVERGLELDKTLGGEYSISKRG